MSAAQWALTLAPGLDERIDRPARITLSEGLTLGRGGAHILLDSASFPNLCSRIHAKVTVSNGEAELHCVGQNYCRVDGKDLAPGQ